MATVLIGDEVERYTLGTRTLMGNRESVQNQMALDNLDLAVPPADSRDYFTSTAQSSTHSNNSVLILPQLRMLGENEDSTEKYPDKEERNDVLDAIQCNNWARLRELSLRPGGFGEERLQAW